MRVLSIDFDYFIDTDINTRNGKFPDGVDEKPLEDLKKSWNDFYDLYPEIKSIGLTKEYEKMCAFLSGQKRGKAVVAQSHKDIWEYVLKKIPIEEKLSVMHYDFHHDNYISGGNRVDCANWLRHLFAARPDTEVLWFRRDDSECVSLEGEFPYPSTTDFYIEGSFDYIFLCFSPEWTPPHLEGGFSDMVKQVGSLNVEYTWSATPKRIEESADKFNGSGRKN